MQNGPYLHLRAGNLRGSGAKNRVFAPLRAEGPDSGIIVLIQERHAVVGLHRMIEVHCDNGIFLAVQRFHDQGRRKASCPQSTEYMHSGSFADLRGSHPGLVMRFVFLIVAARNSLWGVSGRRLTYDFIFITTKKFVLMLAAAMVVMGLGVSCDKDKIQKDDTKPSSGESTVTSLSGTTWSRI